MTVLSKCPCLETIEVKIVDLDIALIRSLSTEWKALDSLLSGGSLASSLRRVRIHLEIEEVYVSEGYLDQEREVMFKKFFMGTLQTSIALEIAVVHFGQGFKGLQWP
jgi:hypothetical protein